MRDIEARCGGLLPVKLTSEWHGLVQVSNKKWYEYGLAKKY
jgi:hypothetical protein